MQKMIVFLPLCHLLLRDNDKKFHLIQIKMTKRLLFPILAGAAMLLPSGASAKQGAPHSVEVSTNFSEVTLSWKTPESPKALAWHTYDDYNGSDGQQSSPQKPAVIYIASVFTPEDLRPVVGEVIESLDYFEYRPVISVTALIYEDGVIVREQAADLSDYKKNTFRTVKFAQPYTIPAGKEVKVAFKIEHGTNMTFCAIMDRAANPKGDLYSYDGKTWYHNGSGTYLITANLANDVDESPDGYNVYVNGVKATASPIADTSYTLAGQASGDYTYTVEAVYSAGAYKSADYYATVKTLDDSFPAPASVSASAEHLDVTLDWHIPLLRGDDNLLTWTNSQYSNAIGGTASSNTKVWIKNEFEPADLISFAGSKLTAINGHFHEATVTGMTLWVMKDGAFIYSEDVSAEKLAEIKAGQWTKFELAEPVELEPGSKYAYGYYLLQTPSTKPISVDTGDAVGSKGNSFSTSSPSSSGFLASKPSWKTLASGNIPGNWMMTADISGGGAYGATTASYNIYRDGEMISTVKDVTTYTDTAPAPGRYEYSVEAVGSDGKVSSSVEADVTAKLPDAYRAPLLTDATLDKESGTVDLKWSLDVELKHHGDAAYMAGFNEDMTLAYGSRFTAAELAPYAGYKITQLNFIIGDDIASGFSLDIYNGSGDKLSSTAIGAGEVNALSYYTLTLESPVEITGAEDLILAYNATIAGGTTPIILDQGPLVTGGAVVLLAGMSSWLNLGTINSSYNDYNIVISAIASEDVSTSAEAKTVELGASVGGAFTKTASMSASDAVYGICPEITADAAPKASALSPVSFNVYCNGELAGTTTDRSYNVTLAGYDIYTLAVTSVYSNGWESPQSDPVVVEYDIEQAGIAPYNLRTKHDTAESGTTHDLEWDPAEESPVLSYCVDGVSYGVGMTGSGTRETYAVQLFPVEKLADVSGQKITHIKFGLYTTELKTASVVIFHDKNIAYEQEIAVSDLIAIAEGYNLIRLNEPFEITGDVDIMVGYHLTYASGIKPMLFDAGPAENGYGNLLSSSAGDTSWKTLKNMNSSLDGNWRIYAVLSAPDKQVVKTLGGVYNDSPATTYNIYRDGEKVVSGISETSYDFAEGGLVNGEYYVTAETAGVESAGSNTVYIGAAGVDSIISDEASPYYDAASKRVVLPSPDVFGSVYNAAGAKVATGFGFIPMNGCQAGLYLLDADNGQTLKFVVR